MKKLLIVLLLAVFSFNAMAQRIHFSWTAPTEREDGSTNLTIAGFNIYIGTSPGNYTIPINIPDGTATEFISDQMPDGTYYGVITAYDTDGRESKYSPEQSTTLVTKDPKSPILKMEAAP